MVSAADLIQALQRRLRLVAPHLRRGPGEFPPGWQEWLETLREHPGRITGASAASLVGILAQRPLAMPPRRLADLNRWQAFSTMWRQQWQPPAPEDRLWRWLAATISVLWHVLFGMLLLWLMYVQYLAHPPRAGETVVQVEWLGTGTPEEAGGGAVAEPAQPAETAQPGPAEESPDVPEPSPPPPASVAVDAPAAAAPTPDVAPAEPEPEPEPVPEPEPAPTEQVVTVSEPVPDSSDEFVLPPPVLQPVQPALAAPELRAPVPTTQVVEIPAPLSSAPAEYRAAEITAPEVIQRVPQVAQRAIPVPLRAPIATVVEPSMTAPQLQAKVPTVRTAAIPSPNPVPAAAAAVSSAEASEPAAAPAAAAAQDATASGEPAPPSGRSPSAATAGAGPRPTPAPGGWTAPSRADDWGDADRNRPGAKAGEDGLYNSDGSVRLAETPGSASPADPPGTITDEIVDLDRAGTWLRRPPIDYEPTAFDKYWRPNETLLEEWVRRSVRTIRIPIPGTNKHIVCQTVLLALGGGCGISDPNLNEQSARARPPPDIPFKPELQEDNGSIRPPPGG